MHTYNKSNEWFLEARKEANKNIPSIIFINAFLLIFVFMGASVVDISYTIWMQAIAIGLFSGYKIITAKDYRNQYKLRGTKVIIQTKTESFLEYFFTFVLSGMFFLFVLSYIIGFEGISYGYMFSGFILQLLYEIKKYMEDKKRKKDYKESLKEVWNDYLVALFPVIVFITISFITKSAIFILFFFIFMKAYYDYTVVYLQTYNRRWRKYMSDKEERYQKQMKKNIN